MFGKLDNPKNQNLKDLSLREICIMLPLLVFVFWIGVCPNTFLDKINPAVDQLVQQITGEKTPVYTSIIPAPVHAVMEVEEQAPSDEHHE